MPLDITMKDPTARTLAICGLVAGAVSVFSGTIAVHRAHDAQAHLDAFLEAPLQHQPPLLADESALPWPIASAGARAPVVELDEPDDDLPSVDVVGSVVEYAMSPRVLADVDEGFHPTLEGLVALTIDRWTEEGFRKLTPERFAQLFPIDELEAQRLAGVPGSLDEVLGGFPTLDDAAEGMRHPRVHQLLEEVCAFDVVLADLELVPLAERSEELRKLTENMRLTREAAALQLMQELERVTSYKHWSLLHRARQLWAL